MSIFNLEVRGNGIAILTFDYPEQKVNKLDGKALDELEEVLLSIKENNAIKVLGIRSPKKGIFIAGADISEIENISDPQEAGVKAKRGQDVFNVLESIPAITVSMINGACLGGGYELALACDLRISSDSSKVKIGLPETSLGILPGFGGTQRLPKLIGIQKSLEIILAGKVVDYKKAYRMRMIDTYFAQEFFETESEKFLEDLLNNPGKLKGFQAKREKRSSMEKLLEGNALGRSFLFKKAREGLIAKTKGQYPAPVEALNVIEKTQGVSLIKGLEIEREHFCLLAPTEICKNLVQIYYTSEALKKESGIEEDVEPLNITHPSVLGAGVMGGGIAWLFSSKDLPVRMKDISWDAINKGYEAAGKIYAQLKKRRKYNDKEISVKTSLISGTLDYTGFKTVDLIVEAVVENMEVKKKVLAEAETKVSETTIIASNTSSLSITEMASALQRPENFVGMHFFNPVNRMPLVEVIPGEKTSPQAITTIVNLSRKMGKTPIVVQNCSGFLVNRILIPYINEAAYILQEGGAVEHMDDLILAFGMPMGPFVLADEVGIDVGYHVAKILEDNYGERMKVAGILEHVFKNEKLLGKKANEGFYKHSSKNKEYNERITSILSNFRSENNITPTIISDKDIVDRCILSMVNEAIKCLEEGVVKNAAYLDMAMIMGSGYPPFRGGLLKYADNLGLQNVQERLGELAEQYGDRFKPAELLRAKVQNNELFYK